MFSLLLSALLASVRVASGQLGPCNAPDCSATTLASSSPSGATSFEVVDSTGCVAGGTMDLYSPVTGAMHSMTIEGCQTGWVRTCLPSTVRFPYGLSNVNPPVSCGSQCTRVQLRFSGTPVACPPPAPSPSCFIDEGLVQVEGGEASPQWMPLAKLQKGDRVLAGASYTDVVGFLHELNSTGKIVCIEHASGELRVSPLHLLFSRGGQKEAKNIEVGDELLVSPGHFSEVLAVRRDKTAGFKAPLTASGSITVDGATASNYATVNGLPLTHAAMHAAFFPARAAATFFDKHTRALTSKIAEKTNAEAQHPLVDFYVKVLKLDDALRSLQ